MRTSVPTLEDGRRLGLHYDKPSERDALRWRYKRPYPARCGAPEGTIDGFTKEHGLKRLVYFERYDDIRTAIQREKNVKHWSRAWKVNLILSVNAEWRDLYNDIA